MTANCDVWFSRDDWFLHGNQSRGVFPPWRQPPLLLLKKETNIGQSEKRKGFGWGFFFLLEIRRRKERLADGNRSTFEENPTTRSYLSVIYWTVSVGDYFLNFILCFYVGRREERFALRMEPDSVICIWVQLYSEDSISCVCFSEMKSWLLLVSVVFFPKAENTGEGKGSKANRKKWPSPDSTGLPGGWCR